MTNTKTVDTGIVAQAKIIGVTIVDLQKSVETTETLTGKLQEIAKGLRKNGVKFGKSVVTCTWRQTISDVITTLCKDKTAKKTCMNYVTSFAKSVNEGTPFSLSDSKGTAKGSASGDSTPATIDAVIAKVFSHKDFDATIKKIEGTYNSKTEERTLAQCVQFYLESEGYKISE